MSNLIYLLCFGDPEYRRMTELCIESLRGPGRFTGDIMVCTDGTFTTTRSDVVVYDASHIIDDYVRTIQDTAEATTVAAGAVDNSVAWHEHRVDAAADIRKAAIKAMKPELADVIDHTRYAHIAVMDTDILAIGDVNPIFDLAIDGVLGMLERQLGNTMLAPSCGGELLRPAEYAAAAAHIGICAGFLCATPSVFRHSMTRWARAIRADARRLNFWADQPYFNVLVLRGEIPFQPLPDMWIDNPPQYVLHDAGDFALHDELMLGSGNAVLYDLFRKIAAQTLIAIALSDAAMPEFVDEHVPVVEALERGDEDAAVAAFLDVVVGTVERITAQLGGEPGGLIRHSDGPLGERAYAGAMPARPTTA